MWSWSQFLAGTVQRGKTQWPSRSSTSSRIHAGGSCWSTASRRAMFSTGWMTTWEWPTHWRSLAMVAAPRRSTAPVAKAVPPSASTSRSSASTRTLSLILPECLGGGGAEHGLEVEGGLAGDEGGDESDGFDLADAEGVGVAVEPELVGDGAEQVVEGFEGQGVAGGGQVAGAGVEGGVGVAEGDVGVGLGVWLRAVLVSSGSYLAMARATSRSVMTGPRLPSVRAARRWSTQRAPASGQGVGLLGDPAGLPGRHLQPGDAFPEQREAVA